MKSDIRKTGLGQARASKLAETCKPLGGGLGPSTVKKLTQTTPSTTRRPSNHKGK